MQMTTRIALLVIAALLVGCGTDQSPVTPSDVQPSFDGTNTLGSGNKEDQSASSSDSTAVALSGLHTLGSGN